MDLAAVPVTARRSRHKIRGWLWSGWRLDGHGQSIDGCLCFDAGDLAVFEGGFREGDGLGREGDGAMDAMQVGEVPEVLPEGLSTPVDVIAGGLAAGQVIWTQVVVDESGGDWLLIGKCKREKTAAEGQGGNIANAGGAFGEEDDRKIVAKSLGHAFGGLGDAACAAGGAVDVDGAGHHADIAKDRSLAELDLGDEDTGADGAVNDNVNVGEVVGDHGAMHGDGTDRSKGDVLGAEKAVADAAEPCGSESAGAWAGDQDFEDGVSEDGGEREDTVDTAEKVEKRQAAVLESSWRAVRKSNHALC